MHDHTSAEVFFAANADEIWEQSPDGTRAVVVSKDAEVRYFPSFAAAVDAWASLAGAIVKEFGYTPGRKLVASNFRSTTPVS